MTTKTPLLSPANPNWYGNLPSRATPAAPPVDAPEEISQFTDQLLELTREGALPRGWLAMMGSIGLVLFVVIADAMLPVRLSDLEDPTWWILIPALLGLVCVGIHPLRLDLFSPLQTPVRFNRRTGKVSGIGFSWDWNPFGRWKTHVHVHDWHNIEAEIAELSSFNGEVIQTRYVLVLAECKPGTREVISRFDLETGHQTTKALEDLWSFVCNYMAHGPDQLPTPLLTPLRPSFVDCLFHYMPWLTPTLHGKQMRHRMSVGAWFVAILFSLFLPLGLAIGVFYFLVTRIAPQATWPTEIDIESSS